MREELAEIVWHIYNVGVYIELCHSSGLAY